MWTRRCSRPALFRLVLASIILQVRSATPDVSSYAPNTAVSNEFDWKLLKEFSGTDYGNVILSPFSLKLVIAMLYEGASGYTEAEIRNTLGFSSNRTSVREFFNKTVENMKKYADDDTLLIGMRIYLSKEIEPHQKFSATAQTSYNTSIEPTDFDDKVKTAQNINSWIEKLTKGNIQKLVNENDLDDAIMLITSAIYYKGEWKNAFDKQKSYRGGFYLSPEKTVQVPFMTTVNKFFFVDSKELDVKILRMQYIGTETSMYVVLPKTKAGLQKLLRSSLSRIRTEFERMENTTVEVSMPKFRFQFGTKLSKTLQNLGIQQMFQNTASFPLISRAQNKKRKLVVTDISQKAGIEVNEEGTEAYAATDITIGNKFGETDETFNVTWPFMFFILHEPTKSILFMGKVENPLSTEQAVSVQQGQNYPDLPPRVSTPVIDEDDQQLPNKAPEQ